MSFTFESFEFVKPERKHGNSRGPIAKPAHNFLKIRELFLSGKTLQEIADMQEPIVTREWIRQILKKHFCLTGKDGGKFLSSTPQKIANEIDRRKKQEEKEERKYQKVFGCSKAAFLEINGCEWAYRKKGTPAYYYYMQWHNSVHIRKIEWNITFPEWWKIWQDSGHYHERGRGKGYCMTRIGDTGGYEIGNVEIKTIGQNFSESYIKHTQQDRRMKALASGKTYQRKKK